MIHRQRPPGAAEGFTLVELLVAITILGIIMGAIGAMIATAFRTSSTVSAELNGSRGPKVVSRYWVPDVEEAATAVTGGGGCGTGNAIVTFTSTAYASNLATPDVPADAGGPRTIVWAEARAGARDQLVRFVCAPGVPIDRTVVVADLTAVAVIAVPTPANRLGTIRVTVPDASRPSKQFVFDVSATDQVTP